LRSSNLAGKECFKRISLVERFFKNNTLNDTTEPIFINILLFNVSPEINNPSSHFDCFFLRELTKTSSSQGSNGYTNEDIPVDFLNFSKSLILLYETLDDTSFESSEITTSFKNEGLAGSLSACISKCSTCQENKDK
jgi:hypothetical protein